MTISVAELFCDRERPCRFRFQLDLRSPAGIASRGARSLHGEPNVEAFHFGLLLRGPWEDEPFIAGADLSCQDVVAPVTGKPCSTNRRILYRIPCAAGIDDVIDPDRTGAHPWRNGTDRRWLNATAKDCATRADARERVCSSRNPRGDTAKA